MKKVFALLSIVAVFNFGNPINVFAQEPAAEAETTEQVAPAEEAAVVEEVVEETTVVEGVSTTIYKWEQIQVQDSGNSENIDLSNYYTKEEINNVIAEINNTIQKETMPDPSEDNVGTIIQYIGDTNEYYTHSHFYQVVEQTIINEDGTETTIYV